MKGMVALILEVGVRNDNALVIRQLFLPVIQLNFTESYM